MLKKGPELKLSEIKVPDFLLDVYYDLRERHLLPVVAILLVALVAAPFVLGRGSGEEAEEAPVAVASAGAATASQSGVLVAKAAPGLRDYRKRLAEETPKNPFKQQYAGGEGEGGGEGSSSEEGGASTGGETTEPIEPTGGEGSGGEDEPEGGHLQYYSFAIDVRVTPMSKDKKDKPEPSVRRDLPELTMLPSRKAPALTFLSVTKDEKNAVMLVSDKVTGLFGDATCAVGAEACQLIVLKPGIPETVVYGADSRTWRIELLEVHLLKTDKLNKAPLGKSKGKESKGKSSEPGSAGRMLQASVHAQEG